MNFFFFFKSYLKPSYLRLRSSCYFTWEFACLAFTHNKSIGFCSKLGWTLSPDAWPVLHRWNSKSSPGKAIDILVLQKNWKLLWLELRKHFRPMVCQQGYVIGGNQDCSYTVFFLANGRNGNAGDDCSWHLMQLNSMILHTLIQHTHNPHNRSRGQFQLLMSRAGQTKWQETLHALNFSCFLFPNCLLIDYLCILVHCSQIFIM